VDVFHVVFGVHDGLEGVIDGGLFADGDQLRLHDAAGRVLGMPEKLLDLLGFFRLDGVENGLGLIVRQFGDDVRLVVRLHFLDDVGELFVGQVLDELFSRVVRQFQNNVRGFVHIQQGEEMQAVLFIEFIDQIGDVGRMHVGEKIDDVELAVATDQVFEGGQRSLLFFLNLLHRAA